MDPTNPYYLQSRPEMLQYLPERFSTLIDVGCAEGFFGAAVKRAFPEAEVWGLEPSPEVAREAERRCDRMISCPLEHAGAQLPSSYFDVVTMNDVLEHLPYPEPGLALVQRILKPDGRLVLSLPNVRYYLNVRDLVFRKDWEYRDFGILDRTHMRFFTQKSAVRTLTDHGFEVSLVEGINEEQHKLHYRALFALAPSFFRDARFPQFAIVASLKA